jgi:hypothetical protein
MWHFKCFITNQLVLYWVFYLIFTLNFVETEDTSSSEDEDIFGSTHPTLLMKHEAKLFAVSSGISGDCQHYSNHVKLESNIDEDEGMLQICGYSVFLCVQNMKVYIKLPLKLGLCVGDRSLLHLSSFEKNV